MSIALCDPLSSLSCSISPHQKTIYVGSIEVFEHINSVLATIPLGKELHVDLDPLCTQRDMNIYGRDFRLILPDSKHLIPHMLENAYTEFIFRAFLPKSCHEIIKNSIRCGFGTGFSKEAHEASLSLAKKFDIETIQGNSVIEGGNCLFFKIADGSQRAFVGLASVVLTMINLEDQKYYEEHFESLKAKCEEIAELDDDFCRMAKNEAILAKFLPVYEQLLRHKKEGNLKKVSELNELLRREFGGISGVKQSLLKDVDESEKKEFEDQARVLKGKWLIAKEVIAHDIGLPLDHIGFLPQLEFHIDLSLFAIDGGYLFYHDEELSRHVLEEIRPKTRNEAIILQEYKAQSDSMKEANKLWKQQLIAEARKLGCQPVAVAGKFNGNRNSCPINLMNSLIAQSETEKVMVSSLSGFDEIDQAFIRAVVDKVSLKIIGLDPKTMMNFYEKTDAGIHCITWER